MSLLNYYGWNKFSIIYEEAWGKVAESLSMQAKTWNKTINHKKQVVDRHKCCEKNMECCRPGYWYNVSFYYALNWAFERILSLSVIALTVLKIILSKLTFLSQKNCARKNWKAFGGFWVVIDRGLLFEGLFLIFNVVISCRATITHNLTLQII